MNVSQTTEFDIKNINNFLSLYGGLSRVEVTATPRDGNCMVTVQ